MVATTTTSLTSKREPEVGFFSCFNAIATTIFSLTSTSLQLPSTSPPPNQRWRKWIGGGEGDERKVESGEEGKQDDWEMREEER